MSANISSYWAHPIPIKQYIAITVGNTAGTWGAPTDKAKESAQIGFAARSVRQGARLVKRKHLLVLGPPDSAQPLHHLFSDHEPSVSGLGFNFEVEGVGLRVEGFGLKVEG